jgi:hypothetical protein
MWRTFAHNEVFSGYMARFFIIAGLLITAGAASAAARYTRHFNPWPVIIDGTPSVAPFWGGINSPKPSLVDFDRDGLVDLMVGDSQGRLGYFRNTDSGFVPVTERLGGVDIATWHLLVDIDGDDDLDLFCDSRTGHIRFFRNDSGPADSPVFTLVDSVWSGLTTGFNNTPDFADIDADGDLDFFFGATSGALGFYENVGTPQNPSMVLQSEFYDSVLAFPGAGGKLAADPHHGFSTIRFVDIDNDNDLDLFWGDIFNPNLYLFENLGDTLESNLTWATETYLTEPTAGFNHPRFADLDSDGDLDMVLGVANAAAVDNLHLLRNLGTADQAFFATETRNLIGTIDIGAYSQPAFGDLDDDGDIDLLLGGGDGAIRFFENTGTPASPVFELITDSLGGIDVGLNAAPALVDWDNDDDLDLLIGTQQGRVQYWRNDGSPASFQFVPADTELGGIKLDQFAVPRPVDWNDDGLVDLVLGEWDFNSFANVLLYENTGSPEAPQLTLFTNALLPRGMRQYTVPEIVDWNTDGRFDMVLGGRSSGLTVYANTAPPGQLPDSLTLVPLPDTVPGADAGTYLAVRFVDIDNDHDLDIFVGEENGGLTFFEKDGTCCLGGRGNVNGDAEDLVNVSDLSFLIDFLFRGGISSACPVESDINDSGRIDVSDLSLLIDFLFRGGPALPSCP